MPLQQNCLVKIQYPSDFKIDKTLTSVEGSGFFAPIGSIKITPNYEENSLEVEACQLNFGSFTTGILTLSKVMNQPFVEDSGSFKISMTDKTDIEYNKVFQVVIEGFIVREDQQRAGAMTGSIVASSQLV